MWLIRELCWCSASIIFIFSIWLRDNCLSICYDSFREVYLPVFELFAHVFAWELGEVATTLSYPLIGEIVGVRRL